MLNLICAGESKLWLADWKFYLIVALIGAIAIGGLAVYWLKVKSNKNYIKPFAISASVLGIGGVLAVVIASLVEVGKEGAFSASYSSWLIAGVLVFIMGGVLLVCLIDRKKSMKNNTVALVYAAVCIAMSFALSYIKFMKMPQGGSITLAALLPISLYSYIFGVKRGIVCCFIYGLLQMIQDPYLVHPIQVIIDYPLAFLLVGMAGVFKKPLAKFPSISIALGISIGIVVRYFCHVISGSVFFASFAPEGMNVWIYSLGYNSYVFIDGLIAIIAAAALMLSRQIQREAKRIELKYHNGKNFITVDRTIAQADSLSKEENLMQAENVEDFSDND